MSELSHLSSPEAGARADALLVVPVGATEQHGPHLPLGVDTDIARALARRLAAAHPRAVIAPAVAYGASGEHQDFPGTLSIGTAATEALLVELCRSATRTWARVLLVVAHGGNAEAVGGAVRLLRAEGRDVRAWAPTWSGDAHAGHVETSVMLALAPEHVAREQAVVGATEPLEALLDRLRAGGVRAVTETGVLGDATTADADEGRALLDAATAALVAFVGHWEREEAAT